MKMEKKHFAGARNILQTKRQGFCVVFLSILKIGTTGPTTGHWTEDWSFYLTSKKSHSSMNLWSPEIAVRLFVSKFDTVNNASRHRNVKIV